VIRLLSIKDEIENAITHNKIYKTAKGLIGAEYKKIIGSKVKHPQTNANITEG
jgi:hypothetical protein